MSAGALNTLASLTTEIDALEAAIEAVAPLVGTGGEEGLNALGQIRQYIGTLDKIQATRVDAVCTAELQSGKAETKDARKSVKGITWV